MNPQGPVLVASRTEGAPVKYRGVPFEFGDRTIIVPPLTLDDVQNFSDQMNPTQEDIDRLVNAPADGKVLVTPEARAKSRQRFDVMRSAVKKAVARNYSAEEFTDADLADFLTARNINTAFDSAMGYNTPRFQVKSLGELPTDWASQQ